MTKMLNLFDKGRRVRKRGQGGRSKISISSRVYLCDYGLAFPAQRYILRA
jgi:hypothetical protein